LHQHFVQRLIHSSKPLHSTTPSSRSNEPRAGPFPRRTRLRITLCKRTAIVSARAAHLLAGIAIN
jgi:hypothetical protein